MATILFKVRTWPNVWSNGSQPSNKAAENEKADDREGKLKIGDEFWSSPAIKKRRMLDGWQTNEGWPANVGWLVYREENCSLFECVWAIITWWRWSTTVNKSTLLLVYWWHNRTCQEGLGWIRAVNCLETNLWKNRFSWLKEWDTTVKRRIIQIDRWQTKGDPVVWTGRGWLLSCDCLPERSCRWNHFETEKCRRLTLRLIGAPVVGWVGATHPTTRPTRSSLMGRLHTVKEIVTLWSRLCKRWKKLE